MTAFRVWAPLAERVELVLRGRRVAMAAEDGGWWTAAPDGTGPGTDYGFIVDGEGPFPDPRSAFQPHGVHALSRVVDHAAFRWTDGGWQPPPLRDAVLYELHIGTFSDAGTFDGAIGHLDALVELGVTHVELMPVAEFPGVRGWGYDGVDLFAPHHAYGGPDGLRRLVDACHARGLAVVLDVVYNHLGPDGNYLGRFGPYFSGRYRTPWGDAINFDGSGSDEVRRFVIDNGRMWLRDYHLDGLRLDAVHEIFDQSAVHILEELTGELHAAAAALGREFVVIAESDLNNPRLVRPVADGGYGLDAHWNDDFRHALHVTLTGERDSFHGQYRPIDDLAASLERVYVFDGRFSPFRGRRHGRPVGDLPANRFVGFLQNHDQAGNRAFGERSSRLLSIAQLELGAAILLTAPFVPLLFAGEEWGASTPFLYFTDHDDTELAEAVRRGRREEFGAFVPDTGDIPDPQQPSSFEASRLRWRERAAAPHADVVDWHRRLVELRRNRPELRDGRRPAVRYDADARWLVASYGSLVVAANCRPSPGEVPMDRPGRVVLASRGVGETTPAGCLPLPAWGVAILELAA